jgi:magnesium chelatase subunit D
MSSSISKVSATEKSDKMSSTVPTFPLTAVVGLENIKEALLLGAVDNRLGGIAIAGRRGTAKSVIARGLHALLPPIECVISSWCNADPEICCEWEDDFDEITKDNRLIRDAPFVHVPLGVTEDRLIGTVDIEASMSEGKAVFQPGLLAKAHRGILYIDEVNLLDDCICNLLFSVLSEGTNVIEREGISISHPCRPLLVVTYNPDEGALREHLLDRIAINLLASVPATLEERVKACMSAIRFQNGASDVFLASEKLTNELKMQVIYAREYLPNVMIKERQVKYLVEEARRGGVLGHRAELFSARVAKASAALDGRVVVTSEDLQRAVQLVILPRCEVIDQPQPAQEQNPPNPPPPPSSDNMQEEDNQEDEERENEEENTSSDDIPQEFMFDPESIIIDPSVLMFSQQGKSQGRTGRAKSLIYTTSRGRYIKPMLPNGKVFKLAMDATLRSAAPYQKN